MQRLTAMGFKCETMPFGDVSNFWARRGNQGPVLCFAGHTDVVPAGNLQEWTSEPFEASIRDAVMYGRGTADMKSGLAAMIVALETFVQQHPNHDGSIAMLITSDEEGRARDGTYRVMQELAARHEEIDWCIIGEPSSETRLGDTVRIGRRGSLSGMLTVRGVQGHVAYPKLADNPIRRFAPALADLHSIHWDDGNDYFPATSFQVVDIRSGSGAPNVTPAELTARFNFRYSTEWDHEGIKKRVRKTFDCHEFDYELNWHLSGEPFLTGAGQLIDAVSASVEEYCGSAPELSTGGGTSDGRFISPAGVDVVELGPISASIHKIDEHVKIDDVITLTKMYVRILERMLLKDFSTSAT